MCWFFSTYTPPAPLPIALQHFICKYFGMNRQKTRTPNYEDIIIMPLSHLKNEQSLLNIKYSLSSGLHVYFLQFVQIKIQIFNWRIGLEFLPICSFFLLFSFQLRCGRNQVICPIEFPTVKSLLIACPWYYFKYSSIPCTSFKFRFYLYSQQYFRQIQNVWLSLLWGCKQ